ncbi:hypothetical protein J6590_057712 [Homalodisca vitripennis]|nr:hypothetical protein J6590_057712 [Homalodisca vitripennis]
MDKIHSCCLDFLREQNLIAQIEMAQEKQSTVLNLSCFIIETVPNSVFELTELKKLYLDVNKLYVLPEQLAKLENLEVLTVDHNNLSGLPSNLYQVKNLKHLNLSHNPLRQLPEEVSKLQRLESLWVNSTVLSELPPSLGQLERLVTLGARWNTISNYPSELCYFFKLRWLTLEGNNLKQLPSEFQNLVGLKHLNLSRNLFEEIPPSIVHIKTLKFCYMHQNCIIAVSEIMLQKLKHLKRLDLRGNPVSSKINRKTYTYVVLENGQNHNTQMESSDSEDCEFSIASSDINNSSDSSLEEPDIELETTVAQLSRFAFSAASTM